MDHTEYARRWDDLAAMDPDYLVDVLGLTTNDLLNAFGPEADEYIEKEFA